MILYILQLCNALSRSGRKRKRGGAGCACRTEQKKRREEKKREGEGEGCWVSPLPLSRTRAGGGERGGGVSRLLILLFACERRYCGEGRMIMVMDGVGHSG